MSIARVIDVASSAVVVSCLCTWQCRTGISSTILVNGHTASSSMSYLSTACSSARPRAPRTDSAVDVALTTAITSIVPAPWRFLTLVWLSVFWAPSRVPEATWNVGHRGVGSICFKISSYRLCSRRCTESPISITASCPILICQWGTKKYKDQ